MRGEASDLDAAAREYQREILARVPGRGDLPAFDLIVFGIGADGHTASIFPGEPTVSIVDRWVAHVPARGDHEARLTLTVPILERAQNAVVLAVGAEKRDALERAWQVAGDLHATPARIVRGVQGSVVWVIDRAAGGLG
jgi:6-phosphogluconolactonase